MKAGQDQPLFAFAGGGTGGHLYPMLSVAVEIRKRVPEARLVFFTTNRAIDARVIRSVLAEADVRIVPQPVQPMPSGIRGVPGFAVAWRQSIKLSKRVLGVDIPEVVVGSGGYGSAPAVCVAARLGIPTALLNPDAIPGKANRFLARKTDVVFAQWAFSELHFSRAARVLTVGCPVRAGFATAERADGVKRFGLDAEKRTLVVTGASQGARSINRAVVLALEETRRLDGWQYLHLAGPTDADLVRKVYESACVPAKVVAYTDEMPAVLAAADLIVTRAGASTLAEITAMGVPAVLLPYPHHKDRHQYVNAAMLTEAGAACMVSDDADGNKTGAALGRTLLSIMSDPDRLEQMSQATAELGEPVASEKITDVLFGLIGRRPGGVGGGGSLLHQGGERGENGGGEEGDSGAGTSIEAAA